MAQDRGSLNISQAQTMVTGGLRYRMAVTLAAEVWGPCDGKSVTGHTLGKGKVIWGRTMEQVFAEMALTADFEGSGRAANGPRSEAEQGWGCANDGPAAPAAAAAA